MKGTISRSASWLAAITLVASLGTIAYGLTGVPKSPTFTAPGIAMTASCKAPNCGGKGQCPKGNCGAGCCK